MIISKRFDGINCCLVDAETKQIAVSGIVTDFRGEEWTLVGGQAPRGEGKTGYVFVEREFMGGDEVRKMEREYYPSVFGLQWVPVISEAEA